MATERFEMRVDADFLERIDQWRQNEADQPSRSEAVRRLLDAALQMTLENRPVRLTDGEKLISFMIADLMQSMKAKSEIDIDLVKEAIFKGHYWSLDWEMPGIFHGQVVPENCATFVAEVLDMWEILEESFSRLSIQERASLDNVGKNWRGEVKFPGFDGNNEGDFRSAAIFLIEKMRRFEYFKNRTRDINSHYRMVPIYKKMIDIYKPIRARLIGRLMSAEEINSVLNCR